MERHNVYGYSSKEELDIPNAPGYSRQKVLNTPYAPGYSRQKVLNTPYAPGYSSKEELDIPNAPGYSRQEVLDTPNVPGYSRQEVLDTPYAPGYSSKEELDIPNVPGYSRQEVLDIPNVPGYSRQEVLDTPNVPGYTRQEVLDTSHVPGYSSKEESDIPNVPGSSRREVLEGQCEDTDPRKMTAEGRRHTSDTSQQPSVYGDQTSIMKQMFEMMKEMYNKIITSSDTVRILPHLLDNLNRALCGRIIQIQHQDKEENEVLKQKIKKLEARNKELLSKVMNLHQNSEDINDPSRLSAVLERYELLRVQEWEKARSSTFHKRGHTYVHSWTYEQGSGIIKKLFNACEKSIQQRTDEIFKVLDIPLNDAMSKSKQEMMREIRKLLRQPYYQNHSLVYQKIVQEAVSVTFGNQAQFLLACCQIYCLLLLQDPPVKAEWNMDKRFLEHVDKKDAAHWKKPTLLWPIMKRGEEIIVKGVVWDKSSMA